MRLDELGGADELLSGQDWTSAPPNAEHTSAETGEQVPKNSHKTVPDSTTELLLGTGEPELGGADELELKAIPGQDSTTCPNARHASLLNSRQSPPPKSQNTETLCEEPPEETPCTAEDEPPMEDKLLTEEELPAEDKLTSEEELSAFFKTSSADSISDVQENSKPIAVVNTAKTKTLSIFSTPFSPFGFALAESRGNIFGKVRTVIGAIV